VMPPPPQPDQLALGTSIDARPSDRRLLRGLVIFTILLVFGIALGIAIAYAP